MHLLRHAVRLVAMGQRCSHRCASLRPCPRYGLKQPLQALLGIALQYDVVAAHVEVANCCLHRVGPIPFLLHEHRERVARVD
eukprot:4121461-Alexandrium_andersonii.AAC.1